MQARTWTMTTMGDDGQPVATRTGLTQDEAVRAVYRAMYGLDPFAGGDREPVEVGEDRERRSAPESLAA